MGKKVVVAIDPFAQSGDTTLSEITAQAVAQGGNAAEVIRDINGKVVQINVNLPDNASQVALDAISGNKGVAKALQFPTVLYDEKFDSTAVGSLPSNADWLWRGSQVVSGELVAAKAEFPVSGANSLNFPFPATAAGSNASLTHRGPFGAFLSVGRTVESQAKFRFGGNARWDILFGGTDPDTAMFFDTGDLKIGPSGTLVVSGLALDTYHTIKVTELIGSTSIAVEVNGVPKGSFPVTPTGNPWRSCFFGIFNVIDADDRWMDDLLITGVA